MAQFFFPEAALQKGAICEILQDLSYEKIEANR